MLKSTLTHLRCPHLKDRKTICRGELSLRSDAEKGEEVRSGKLVCGKCKSQFPIISGIALLVPDVHGYLIDHVKGISRIVPDSEIPTEFKEDYLAAKSEMVSEHIEEDLEAARVNALYVIAHYLHAGSVDRWWFPKEGPGSGAIDSIIKQYWDHGPFQQLEKWISQTNKKQTCVELGCGVGGLYPVLQKNLQSYLGVDSSFASIALARHLALGMSYNGSIAIPEDLLRGQTSRELKLPAPQSPIGTADFIVGDLINLPLAMNTWDIAVALNTMDMLEVPGDLPEIQKDVLRQGGTAMQSCPYIWRDDVARSLRKVLPKEARDSARAAEWLYEKAGYKILEKIDHVPWLFFKHVRQLEIYSVHMFAAQKQ